MPTVFLSYARADGEGLAANLRERLAQEASDVVIRQDRLFLEGGVGWWRQITEAIDSVEFLVLLMTSDSIKSSAVQKEWRYARQQGVSVYPVKGAKDFDFHINEMPRWMRAAHFFDLEKEWPTFLAHLRSGRQNNRVPFMAPDSPRHFVQRIREFKVAKSLLLDPENNSQAATKVTLVGAGGVGKTTLATALCHDEDMIDNFYDGILWITLGEAPDILGSLITAYAALTGDRPTFASEDDVAFQLSQKLEQRTCLLVIDDVWDATHLRPLLRGGKSCARLITTRDANIAAETVTVSIEEMQPDEAVKLLTGRVPELSPESAKDLALQLGDWAIALDLAGAMLRERMRQGNSADKAVERLRTIIERRGPKALEDPTADRRHRTISSVLQVSLEMLGATDLKRFTDLAVFADSVPIPLAAAATVWELDEFDSEHLAQHLARLSLLKLDLDHGVFRLHGLMRAWLLSRTADIRDIHNRLLNAWSDWWNLPDMAGEYAWRWLVWHLVQADRKDDLFRILWDPRWMQAKLDATDVNALIADYEYLRPSIDAELLQSALRLSSHVLMTDPQQLASQLTGRLLPYRDSGSIRQFLGRITTAVSGPWLRPVHPALHPPGTQLLRTLDGHSDHVLGVAITPDGKSAVSASSDRALKVWNLTTGRVERALERHSECVTCVVVTPDGKKVISGSADNTLSVWDLGTGQSLQSMIGHSAPVSSVVATPDGQSAISGCSDATLIVWELANGQARQKLEGHSESVTGVAVTPNGKFVVSSSKDKTLRLWQLDSGQLRQTMQGHSDSVTSVALTPDGSHAEDAR